MLGNLTWIDLIILLVLFLYGFEGYGVGAVAGLIDLVKLIISFLVGLKFYNLLAGFILYFLAIQKGIINVIAFFITVIIVEFLLSFIFYISTNKLKKHFINKSFELTNKIFGVILGVSSGVFLLIFLLTAIVALPVSTYLKQSITISFLGEKLLNQSQIVEGGVNALFKDAGDSLFNFLTVEPDSNSSVKLNFTTSDFSIDKSSEMQMFIMINKEREKAGVPALTFNTGALQNLAREYGKDMLRRGYFSHFTPEGLSPFDRMTKADIPFQAAGENLAFSPSVELSMQGLMNSPGHRKNILSPDFHQVGVGVIDAKIYGKVFVQDFTD